MRFIKDDDKDRLETALKALQLCEPSGHPAIAESHLDEAIDQIKVVIANISYLAKENPNGVTSL